MSEENLAEVEIDPIMKSIEKITKKTLESFAASHEITFEIRGKPVSPEHIASATGLLPIIVFQTAHWYKEATGKTLPLYYKPEERGLCDVIPGADKTDNGTIIAWLHCTHYALEVFVKNFAPLVKQKQPLPLDGLYDSWLTAARAEKLDIRLPVDYDPVKP